MEAKVISTDGTEQVVTPKNGKTFTLEELQECVGGYIEMISLDKETAMFLNEEGKLNNLPFNHKATEVAQHRLRPSDFVVGNVLVVPHEMYD